MSYIRDKQTNLLAMPMSLYNIPFLYSYIWIPWHSIHAVPFNIARANVYSRVRTRLIPVLTLDFSVRSERSGTRLKYFLYARLLDTLWSLFCLRFKIHSARYSMGSLGLLAETSARPSAKQPPTVRFRYSASMI